MKHADNFAEIEAFQTDRHKLSLFTGTSPFHFHCSVLSVTPMLCVLSFGLAEVPSHASEPKLRT